ncbi:hypothetical protein VV869_23325 [Photobacterium sp. MCCC 1A19761]|uniref:hypothetical protein n=1 Tax=Photobacterium sp. MCCC 1A19761 TaxID=3115000 RepID=UPI00307EB03A
MYDELSKQLDTIGYEFDQDELKKRTINAHKKQVIKAMLLEAKRLNFDVYSNQAKTILAAIVSEPEISVERAVKALKQYASGDAYDQQLMRETLFSTALRASEEFKMVIMLNGEGVNRVA